MTTAFPTEHLKVQLRQMWSHWKAENLHFTGLYKAYRFAVQKLLNVLEQQLFLATGGGFGLLRVKLRLFHKVDILTEVTEDAASAELHAGIVRW